MALIVRNRTDYPRELVTDDVTVTGTAPLQRGAILGMITSGANAGIYALAAAAATDGSQNPTAVLVDYCDPSAGNVKAPIYLQGEFNINAVTLGPGITPLIAKSMLRRLNIYLKDA